MEKIETLSVYVFKTKEKYGNNWDEQVNHDNELLLKDVSAKYDKLIKALKKADEGSYDDTYIKGMEKIVKEVRFPNMYLSSVGVNIDSSITPRSVSDLIDKKNEVLMKVKFTADTEFIDSQEFIRLFEKYKKNEPTFWFTPEDLDDLISICNAAGKNKKNTDEYMEKLKAFKAKLKHLKGLVKKGYLLYVVLIKQ